MTSFCIRFFCWHRFRLHAIGLHLADYDSFAPQEDKWQREKTTKRSIFYLFVFLCIENESLYRRDFISFRFFCFLSRKKQATNDWLHCLTISLTFSFSIFDSRWSCVHVTESWGAMNGLCNCLLHCKYHCIGRLCTHTHTSTSNDKKKHEFSVWLTLLIFKLLYFGIEILGFFYVSKRDFCFGFI